MRYLMLHFACVTLAYSHLYMTTRHRPPSSCLSFAAFAHSRGNYEEQSVPRPGDSYPRALIEDVLPTRSIIIGL